MTQLEATFDAPDDPPEDFDAATLGRLQQKFNAISGEELDAANQYLTWLQKVLKLQDWEIYIGANPANERAMAAVEPMDTKLVAVVSLGYEWSDYSPKEQALALLHEMLHVTHRATTDVLRLDARHWIPQKAYDSLAERQVNEFERMVDSLSKGLLGPLGAVHVMIHIREELSLPVPSSSEGPPRLRAIRSRT